MQASGRVTVKVNGDTLRSRPGASFRMGGVTREERSNDQGTIDHVEQTQAAQVQCTLTHVATTDLPALRNFKAGVVNFETDTGVVYTIPDAFTSEIGDLSNGEVQVTFMGNPAEQVS